MTAITQCSECGTRFKVTDAQLDAHDGLVRCGRCHQVFNAHENLQDTGPSPQLSLPIEAEPPTAGNASADETEADLTPIKDVPGLEEEPATLAQQVRFVEELTDEVSETTPRKRRWLNVLLPLLLALVLLAQAVYHFRVELAARLPGLKPLLAQYCTLLHCAVALPQQAELMAIESSELVAEPDQTGIVTLVALIHNRAAFAQAYPSLELTLTDLQDKAVARRVFRPADYLHAGEDEKLGLPANRDLDVKLRLDTTDLKPSGYRLFLFYPH
ncbi:MAG TPA: DUF3426 domain-containing protein [Sideroxyarcus sp.]|nr:DUF3426 domain-containing protein [Sideroxyarcus sp.]